MQLQSLHNQRSLQNVNLSIPVNWDHPLNRNLVAWWLSLPQWSGSSRWYDLCGKYFGTLTNGASWVNTDRIIDTGSLSFDGTNDYIDVSGHSGSISPLNLNNNFTISAWIKTVPSYPDSGGIVSWGEQSNGRRRSMILWSGGSLGTSRMLFLSGFGADANAFGTTNVADERWHFAAVTLSSSNVASVYVDGKLEATRSLILFSYSFSTVNIGRTQYPEYHKGLIDDVRIYNRVLSASEVNEYYNLSRDLYPDVLNRTPYYILSVRQGDVYTEAPEGGVTASGEADASSLNHLIVSGGTVASGEADASSLNHLIGSGGTVASGDGTSSRYQIVSVSGGCTSGAIVDVYMSAYPASVTGNILLSGDSVHSNVLNVGSSGGISTSGLCTEVLLLNPPTFGGILVGGFPNNFCYFEQLSLVALIASGQADMPLHDVVQTEGGCVVSGNADTTSRYSVESTGGLLAQAKSSTNCTYAQDSTISVVLNSSALIYKVVRIIEEISGLEASGSSAFNLLATFVSVPESVLGGNSIVSSIIFVELDFAGVSLNGSARVLVNKDAELSGGLLIGGNLIVAVNPNPHVGGGLQLGSESDIRVIITEIPQDGKEVNGEAIVEAIFNFIGLGRTSLSGSSRLSNVNNLSTESSGLFAKPKGSEFFLFNCDANGGILSSGEADVLYVEWSQLPSGVIITGSANVHAIYTSEVLENGIIVSGNSSISSYISIQMNNGIILGGISSWNVSTRPSVQTVKPRFAVGDAVYFLLSKNKLYVSGQIRGISWFKNRVYYNFGDNELVPQKFILSFDEYQEHLYRAGISKRNNLNRRLQ